MKETDFENWVKEFQAAAVAWSAAEVAELQVRAQLGKSMSTKEASEIRDALRSAKANVEMEETKLKEIKDRYPE